MKRLILLLLLIPWAIYAQQDTVIYYYDTISEVKCQKEPFSTECYVVVNTRIGKIHHIVGSYVEVGDTVVTIKHIYRKGIFYTESVLKRSKSTSPFKNVIWE